MPPVVLVPGLGALGYLVDALEGCGAWTRSFLLDVPGFGHRGPRAVHPPDVSSLAEAVRAWLDVVPRAPVVLAGHSTGAQIACRVAAARPERVRSLVLMSPVFPPAARRVTGLLRVLPGTVAHESPGEIRVTAPYFLRAGRDLHRYLRSALREAPERLVDRVACPVLVVRGEHDALSPQPWVSELAARAPRGRWVTVPGAHNFPYRRGGLTSALIAEAARHR